jgi:dephospho-CoA kinase
MNTARRSRNVAFLRERAFFRGAKDDTGRVHLWLMNLMNRKHVIGLVGGIGSGKSLVARLLAERSGFVIDADPIAHQALRDPAIREKIVARFGREILGNDGEVERKKLAAPVFADESARRELESWIFPWVGERARELINRANLDPAVKFIVVDAPVMLEAGWNDVADRIIYVDTPREVRLTRLAQRGWTPEQVSARERAQLSLTEKARRADVAVDNGGNSEATARQLDRILRGWNLSEVASGLADRT